ncbi:MAG: class I SAM-dependent methyltransferase [Candidatus Nanoarchaeia archaeon]|jgi:ubiquinone/menaquinone biosynthesis C-methylase UbiE
MDLREITEGYSTKKAQDIYSKIGLWPEEEKLFNELFKKGSKILDIGCGGGRTSIPLAKKGNKIYAIDITPSMIKIAKNNAKKNKVNIEFKTISLIKIDYPEKFFDNALFSFNGIEHISPEDIQKSLNNVSKSLKKGGYFVFTAHTFLYPGKGFKYWNIWIRKFFSFYFKKIFGLKNNDKYFGDLHWNDYGKDLYAHFAMPNYYINRLKKAGFSKITIIPKNKIMYNKKYSVFDNFKETFLFFICKK